MCKKEIITIKQLHFSTNLNMRLCVFNNYLKKKSTIYVLGSAKNQYLQKVKLKKDGVIYCLFFHILIS